MNLPSMFVEYLITGSCALLWVRLLLIGESLPSALNLRGMDGARLALLVPAIYVLGMFVDFIGKGFVVLFERLLRRFPGKAQDQISALRYWDFFLHAPEVGKQIEMRSSRDRVARGALANIVIGAIILADQTKESSQRWSIGVGGLLLALLCLAIWLRFYIHTSNFEIGASEAIREKLGRPVMGMRQQQVESGPHNTAPASDG